MFHEPTHSVGLDEKFGLKMNHHPRIFFERNIAEGVRFRYDSEIQNKSLSPIKSATNDEPIVKVCGLCGDGMIILEVVTQKFEPHFNELYECPKENVNFHKDVLNGKCIVKLDKIQNIIRLDFLGIRKMKKAEAEKKIKQSHPHLNEKERKFFYEDNKELVKVRLSLYQDMKLVSTIYSNDITHQVAKDNWELKIKYMEPKVVAGHDEDLIVILERKVSAEKVSASIKIRQESTILRQSFGDGRVFVFPLPPFNCLSEEVGKFIIRCENGESSTPIRILSLNAEDSKKRRRLSELQDNRPLNKVRKCIQPQKESVGIMLTDYAEIESDSAAVLKVDQQMTHDTTESDSGISSNRSRSVSESMSDRVKDDLMISDDGFEDIPSITIPAKVRAITSQFDYTDKDVSTKKLLSEIARIGHDFAFGKVPDEMFQRITEQLPVVFTLQDDVGDTPLNNAILKGNFQNAEIILNIIKTNCPWSLDLVNSSGHTPLMLAATCAAPLDLVKNLIQSGCRLDETDDSGKTAITYAIEYRNLTILEVFLERVKTLTQNRLLSRQNDEYYTPLQTAILNNFPDGVAALVKLKDRNQQFIVDVNERSLLRQETALHMAVIHNADVNTLSVLLDREDIDINARQSDGVTPLGLAIQNNLGDIVKFLQTYKASADCGTSDDSEESSGSDGELTDDICPTTPISEMSNLTTNLPFVVEAVERASIKERVKSQIITILLDGNHRVSLQELNKLVKPTFASLFRNFKSVEDDKQQIAELLHRFNCLPNSVGQLTERLGTFNRMDLAKLIKDKICL